MALRFQDPLSTWGTGATSRTNMTTSSKGWLSVSGSASCVDSIAGAPGGWSLYGNGGFSYLALLSIGDPTATIGLNVRLRLASLENMYLFDFRSATGQIYCSVHLQQNGGLSFKDTNGNVLATSAAGVFTIGSFIHFEAKVTVGTSGSFQLRVNKAVIFNLTGLSVIGGSGVQVGMIHFTAGSGTNIAVAQPIIWDTTGSFCNDFLGPKVSYLIPVSSDGATLQWGVVGGAGSSYGSVNEIPQNGATTYLEATTNGDVTLMGFQATSLSNVVALTIQHTDSMSSAGASEMKASLANGGSVTPGTSRNPAFPAWTAYQDHYYQDPAGSGATSLTAPLAAGSLSVKLERTV